jgi:hypothetical protein
MTIIGILIAIAGVEFAGWTKGYNMEVEVKQIYSELMSARVKAMQRNTCRYVVFGSVSSYSIYEDALNGSCLCSPVPTNVPTGVTNPKTLTYPVTAGSVLKIKMNSQGLVTPTCADESVQAKTIRVDSTVSSDYDCINLAQTRITIGKWNGSVCDAK